MRWLLLLLLVGCASRQTAWTTLDAHELDDGSEAFVIVDSTALHVADVKHVDDRFTARVVHAWALPPAGAVAIAETSQTRSPEQIARSAGWQELPYAHRKLDVPISAVRSARGVVDVEPDEDPPSAEGPSLVAATIASAILDVALTPACCRCRHY